MTEKYKVIGPLENYNGEAIYHIQDIICGNFIGGDYHDYRKCMDDCKLLNDMDTIINHSEMLMHENVFVCDTDKLFQPEVKYDFKRYIFKELLEEQNDKIKDQKFIINWQDNEISHLETYNNQLEAENECLELLLEHKLNDLTMERYEYVKEEKPHIKDNLTNQKIDDMETLTLLLNNYSLTVRKMLNPKGVCRGNP